MKKFSLADILIGLILTSITLVAFVFQLNLFESLELKTYDLRSLLRQSAKVTGNIAIVAIDDDSISKLGRWPWPRALLADGILAINNCGAKVLGINIILSEPDKNQGLDEIRRLQELLPTLLSKKAKPNEIAIQTRFNEELIQAQTRLDNDSKLINALGVSKNIVLPMYFELGEALNEAETVVPENTLTTIENPEAEENFPVMPGRNPIVPLESFAALASAIGHSNLIADRDGVLRSETPIINFLGDYYPSFAISLVRTFLNIPVEDIKFKIGSYLKIGKASIPLDSANRMLISYHGQQGTVFASYSFYDVLNQKIDANALKDKIVILGNQVTGITDRNTTPFGNNFPGTEIIASVVEDILQQSFITRPRWANNAELGLILFIGLFVTLLLPRLKALWTSLISIMLLLVISIAGTYFFINNGWWLKIFYPVFLLISAYIIIISKHFLITEKKKDLVEAGAIETNKMLGLSFQGQGMLDMAFEKFRRCPVDDQMKELLFNLGLDFERKRQFNKAAAVYEHIMAFDKTYKNIGEKIKQLKAAADGAVFGGLKKESAEGTVIVEGSGAAAPTLGRYQVVKELGRGAMGTVYLGKDPKINRTVAIKTIRFESDINELELKAIKERFFREAESAGALNHPNIIKIFDAGEDSDVAYIAMELLEGEDLKKYTEKANLLPFKKVVEYVINVAEGLDYAHNQGIIHRDIKPANIMMLNDGTLRITDFGIARITASSKTQTGTVLGTPSYMSPEQLSGKKVDGRSDLFSLGVMLYEMLTGNKPFSGDSIAELLFKISNEKQPSPKEYNPGIPDSLVQVIDKALQKNPDLRYQRGQEFAKDLKECLKTL